MNDWWMSQKVQHDTDQSKFNGWNKHKRMPICSFTIKKRPIPNRRISFRGEILGNARMSPERNMNNVATSTCRTDKNSKTPACQQVSLPPSIPAGGPVLVIWSWLAFLSNSGAGGIWQVTSAHFLSSPLFLCLYMYVCVSRKQSDEQHPDLTDGALRPVFLALLPEPVTPAALLWGGRQSRPQPILVPEETQ